MLGTMSAGGVPPLRAAARDERGHANLRVKSAPPFGTVGNLTVEATHRGLVMHQMAGFDSAKARELYALSEDFDPVTVLAIGHRGAADDLPEMFREKETAKRSRNSVESLLVTA